MINPGESDSEQLVECRVELLTLLSRRAVDPVIQACHLV